MNLRPTGSNDAALIEAISASAYDWHFPSVYTTEILRTVVPIIVKASAGLLASGRFYVAIDADHGAVGCGGWSEERPGTGEKDGVTGHLRHFAVAPSAGRRGVGRLIVEACLLQASAAGIRQFEVLSSLNATGFYTRMGFVEIGQKTVMIAGTTPFPAIEMHRSI